MAKLEAENVFNELNFPIKEEEVNMVIKKLKSKKAVGLDNIFNEMLKLASHVLCKPLTRIFNAILLRAMGNIPVCEAVDI